MPCGKEENVKKIVERKFWSGKRRIRRVRRRAKSFFFPFEGKKKIWNVEKTNIFQHLKM
jgi:hypothetical protein